MVKLVLPEPDDEVAALGLKQYWNSLDSKPYRESERNQDESTIAVYSHGCMEEKTDKQHGFAVRERQRLLNNGNYENEFVQLS
jgi:hypothetical protein